MSLSVARRLVPGAPTTGHAVPVSGGVPWLVPLFAVWTALLLIVQALAGIASRHGHVAESRAAYWTSFGLIAVTALAAQVLLRPSSRQRLGIVVVLALGLYMIKVLSYPTGFTYFDELSHLRTAFDLERSGHLFHHNPALVVSPFFPGLEVLTVALARLGGLPITTAGIVLIALGRVVLAAALYALFSGIGKSRRVGGVAAVLYMANPSFLYFDSDFSYESLALPFAASALVLTMRWMDERGRPRYGVFAAAAATLGAVVVTHHTTSYLLAVFMVVLCLTTVIARRSGGEQQPPWLLTLWMLLATGLWLALVAPSTVRYLGQIFGPAVDGAAQVLFSSSRARAPFSGATAAAAYPLWLRLCGFASVLIVVGCLPTGLALAWRRRSSGWGLVCAVVGLAYVPVQALRVSGAGVESANRSTEFLFFGIALLLALCLIHLVETDAAPVTFTVRGRRVLGRRRLVSYVGSVPLRIAILAAGAVLFIGGVVSLWPPYGLLPGPYLPGSDVRSISGQGIAAARWLEKHYGPGQRVLTDRSNAQIVAAYAAATPVAGDLASTSVFRVFVSDTFDQEDKRILRVERVDFLLVDTRLAEGLPVRGYYFSGDEIGGAPWTEPISVHALRKFTTSSALSLVYDNGPIQIYAVKSKEIS
jgi:hypothetical protein